MNSVFIVDDHPVIRLAVRMLLENQNYKVVGESDNGVDAIQMIRETQPELVILDISIPIHNDHATADADLQLFRLVNDRELMVLQLIAQGRSNQEIAKGMFISNKTVSTYKKRLMQKLQVDTLVDLIEMAKRNALV